MTTPEYRPPSYPVLQAVARHGKLLAVLLGLALLASGAWLGWRTGEFVWPVVGLVAGALVATLLASYAEVARIVIDTLVPR